MSLEDSELSGLCGDFPSVAERIASLESKLTKANEQIEMLNALGTTSDMLVRKGMEELIKARKQRDAVQSLFRDVFKLDALDGHAYCDVKKVIERMDEIVAILKVKKEN
jgi:hypothetical protein